MPCQPFLVGFGSQLTCCEGAQNILNQATTTATRAGLCVNVSKNAAKAFGINPDGKQLPSMQDQRSCTFDLTDCNVISLSFEKLFLLHKK
ncbi:non-specific lipid-transfer protein A-like [Fagus crenata]